MESAVAQREDPMLGASGSPEEGSSESVCKDEDDPAEEGMLSEALQGEQRLTSDGRGKGSPRRKKMRRGWAEALRKSGCEVGRVAGGVGKHKIERIPFGNRELVKGFRQRRDGVQFKHSLWLPGGGRIRWGEAGSR